MHRYRGRVLSFGAAFSAAESEIAGRTDEADSGLRDAAALALAVRSARPGNLSVGEWAGVRGRRAYGRKPDARGRNGEHVDSRAGGGASRRQCESLAQLLAVADKVGGLSSREGARSGKSIEH